MFSSWNTWDTLVSFGCKCSTDVAENINLGEADEICSQDTCYTPIGGFYLSVALHRGFHHSRPGSLCFVAWLTQYINSVLLEVTNSIKLINRISHGLRIICGGKQLGSLSFSLHDQWHHQKHSHLFTLPTILVAFLLLHRFLEIEAYWKYLLQVQGIFWSPIVRRYL